MQAHLAAAEIQRRRAGRHLLLLLDFDGTLAPFNPDPAAVCLEGQTAALLNRLAASHGTTLGIISGRRLADLQQRVALNRDVYLAGFHGLEIQAPDQAFMHPGATAAVSRMRAISQQMQPYLGELPGVFLEDKILSIALHYREAVPAVRVVATSRFMDAARADIDEGRLRLLPGSCVIELLPGAAWHKGSALEWIRARVTATHGPTFTAYIGDDVTDEDAFRAVGPEGIAISASERAKGGEFSVDGPDGVRRLLHSLDGPADNGRT